MKSKIKTKDLTKNFQTLRKEIQKAKEILFITHRAPDGDAVGSALALNLYLKRQKKVTYIYMLGAPHFLNTLPHFQEIKTKAPRNKKFDLTIALDYAGEERLEVPPQFTLDESKIISIDHHPGGKRIGRIKIINTSASSTCEILYNFFKTIQERVNHEIANCLLAGISTDTAGFSFLTRRSEKIVSELLDRGAELSKIMKGYNSISLSRARILAKMISRIKKEEELDMLWSWLTLEDFKKAREKSFLQDPPIFPDFLSYIGKAKVYLLLIKYKNDRIKGSLRSRNDVDVSKIAESLGGGGHKSASGFRTTGTIQKVLAKIKEELQKEIK